MLLVEYTAKEELGQENPLRLEVGYGKIYLRSLGELLALVVVKGFAFEPLRHGGFLGSRIFDSTH